MGRPNKRAKHPTYRQILWTACPSFKKYQLAGDVFAPYILDFSYFLIDINRYTEKELLDIANLVATVFLLDQKQDEQQLLNRLKALLNTIKKLTPEELNLLKNWLINIVPSKEPGILDELKNIISQTGKEAGEMISNLELSITEALEKREIIGMEKGMVRGMVRGLEKGKYEGLLLAAKNLMQLGIPRKQISLATGLNEKDLDKLAEELEN